MEYDHYSVKMVSIYRESIDDRLDDTAGVGDDDIARAGAGSSRDGEHGGDTVDIRVADSGGGIPPEHLPLIFERFHRVDQARTDQHFGIGLSIVKAIVVAHRGSITAESEPGRGTTMHVELPDPQSFTIAAGIQPSPSPDRPPLSMTGAATG